MSITEREQEITAKEAAMLLGVSKPVVYRLLHAGHLEGRRPSTRIIWFRRASVLAYREQTTIRPRFTAVFTAS